MANKQTTPQMVGVQGSYVNTNGNPLIPQTNWKSPLRQIAQIGEQGVSLAKQYQDIKFDGYQAQYSIMANQMYHEMQDAADPCQIDEIQKKYEQKFSQPLEDNIWGKSYLTSQYRKKWENTMKDNTLKIRLAMQHKFNAIETEKTLNSMAMAAASTGDINAMQSYFNSGMAIIDREQDMTVDVKNSAKKAYAKMLIESSFNLNPNIANSFVKANAASLVPYGIDPNEINQKTDAYNIQQENRLYTKEKRAKEQKKEASEKLANDSTIQFLKDGNLENFEAKIEEVRVDNPAAALKMYKVAYPEDAKETAKRKAVKQIVNAIETYENDPTEDNKSIALDLIDDAALNLHITDTNTKMYRKRLGISDEGIDWVEMAKTKTETELREEFAKNEVNSSMQTNLLSLNKAYSGYDGTELYIRENKGVVTNDEIISKGFSDAQTTKLIDIAQQERKAAGYGSAEFEILAKGIRTNTLPKNAKELYNKLPESEKAKIHTLVKQRQEKIHDIRMKGYRNSAKTDKNFNIASVDTLYANGDINKDEKQELINEILERSKNNLATFKADKIDNIVQRKYETLDELTSDLMGMRDLYDASNLNNYESDFDSLISLYNKTDDTIKDIIAKLNINIDKSFGGSNIQFGKIDTITPLRIAELKEAVTNSVMQDYFAKNSDGSPKMSSSEIIKKYNEAYLKDQWFGKEENGVRIGGFRPTTDEIMNNLINLMDISSTVNTGSPNVKDDDSEKDKGRKETSFWDWVTGNNKEEKNNKQDKESVVRVKPQKKSIPTNQGQLIDGKMNIIIPEGEE